VQIVITDEVCYSLDELLQFDQVASGLMYVERVGTVINTGIYEHYAEEVAQAFYVIDVDA
jgi:ATP:corrinoid adenosyltransferase